MARISNMPKWMGLYNKYGSNDFYLEFLSAAALVHEKHTSLANECLDEFENADAERIRQMTELLLTKQDIREVRPKRKRYCRLDKEYLERKILYQYGDLKQFSLAIGRSAGYVSAMLRPEKSMVSTALMLSSELGVPVTNVILGGAEDEE